MDRSVEADRPLQILLAAAEVAPFAKTGGLGDVCGALPQALAERGHQVAVMMPLFHSCRTAGIPIEPLDLMVEAPVQGRSEYCRLWRGLMPNSQVPIYFLEHNLYYDRDDARAGHTIYQYKGADGHQRDYEDNLARFTFFCRAVLNSCHVLNYWPDILHVNDWHTGLIPVYLRTLYNWDVKFRRMKSLLTIHNMAYQGRFAKEQLGVTGLDWGLFKYEYLEYLDMINLLKGGIVFADAVNAVSRRYADEIATYEGGYGLDPVIRNHWYKVTGIMNGVDYSVWNPATDRYLPVHYQPDNAHWGKARCKEHLQRISSLPVRHDVPVLGLVSRLVKQKGIELIQGCAWDLMNHDVQLVVVGTGEPAYEGFLRHLANTFPHKVAVALEFSESLAHQVVAGADMYLMPSLYEPSGLNQLYSLKYGTIPIVRFVGGLADSVTDLSEGSLKQGIATGFTFNDYHPMALLWAIRRAMDCYRQTPAIWAQLQQNAMLQDWSWKRGAANYETLYYKMLEVPS